MQFGPGRPGFGISSVNEDHCSRLLGRKAVNSAGAVSNCLSIVADFEFAEQSNLRVASHFVLFGIGAAELEQQFA
jgi:hypothetical protein